MNNIEIEKIPYPTREEIEELAREDIFLDKILRSGYSNNFTWQQTLQLAVKILVAQNKELQDNMVKVIQNSVNQPIIVVGDSPSIQDWENPE